jgi:hypothetical protein
MKKPVLAFAAALCLIATAQPAPAQDWPQHFPGGGLAQAAGAP